MTTARASVSRVMLRICEMITREQAPHAGWSHVELRFLTGCSLLSGGTQRKCHQQPLRAPGSLPSGYAGL